MPSDDQIIGFLGLYGESDGDSAVRAGLLVTDNRGYPQEFRVASPVRPNALQRSLYGSDLNQFMISDILAAPLLKDVQIAPSFVLANRREALTTRSPYPVLYVSDAAEFVPLPRERSLTIGLARGQADIALVQFIDDAEEELESAATVLSTAHDGHDIDPFELFDRILNVIEQLAQEDRRYRA